MLEYRTMSGRSESIGIKAAQRTVRWHLFFTFGNVSLNGIEEVFRKLEKKTEYDNQNKRTISLQANERTSAYKTFRFYDTE